MRSSDKLHKQEKNESKRIFVFSLVLIIICQSAFILLNWSNNKVPKLVPTVNLEQEYIKSNNSAGKDLKYDLEDAIPSFEGVAVTTFLGSPKLVIKHSFLLFMYYSTYESVGFRWFQNRYSMMINNVHGILPKSWAIQIVHNDKKMALEGCNKSTKDFFGKLI